MFYDLIDAMLDHPQAKVIVWGPGYQGWDDSATIQQNMDARFRCGEIDIHINFLGMLVCACPHLQIHCRLGSALMGFKGQPSVLFFPFDQVQIAKSAKSAHSSTIICNH